MSLVVESIGSQTARDNYARGRDRELRTYSKWPITEREFVWGAGIECSFLPHLNVDQFEWTQHNRFWREDFKRARQEVGLSALRYSFPWHQLEPQRGSFDWSMSDERIQYAGELGLDIYLDVMHFGTPLWLKQAAGDPEFPEALERVTDALVRRYGSAVRAWCPCNEPLVLALFSGDFGFWPPHSRHWRGYMPVLSRIVQAVSRSIRAIRRAQPEATVLLCDHMENYGTRDESLQEEVRRRNLRRFLVLDLLAGRVDWRHPLFNWLNTYGLSELDLEWFRANPQMPDLLGLDYYAGGDWQLERNGDVVRQRRSDNPAGIHRLASTYHARYGLPMMVTETSIDGKPINREIWLEQTIADCRQLREEGIPLLGYFWWPLIDQLDWDGAMRHSIGKIHHVGIFSLRRKPDGTLEREATPLVQQYSKIIARTEEHVGELAEIQIAVDDGSENTPLGDQTAVVQADTFGSTNGKKTSITRETRLGESSNGTSGRDGHRATGKYGIVVFSHLRWGFVWQRPQQFLSRFARKHKVLFFEEPYFDLADDCEPRLDYHKVMPNVTVAAPHMPRSWQKSGKVFETLRTMTREAMNTMNDAGEFDRPLLWYYSPMDAGWSLGHFEHRGIVYDCMDELSKFHGAPPSLVRHETRLLEHADIVFTGGYELGERKKKQHANVHTFGCAVEFEHFSKASDQTIPISADIDFIPRPILGWFGVIDERLDYGLIKDIAAMRQDWSLAMIGPVVKMDPNQLPHEPNLYWLGGRDYDSLPNYCRAFNVCIMPFAINAATEYINPTKGLEYMATGRPIVATPVRDVVRQWSDIIRIANTAAEFVAAADEAMASQGDQRVARGLELAKRCSWDGTVGQMGELISQSLSSRNGNHRKIVPLDDSELDGFRATPGS